METQTRPQHVGTIELAVSPQILETIARYEAHLFGRKFTESTVDTYVKGVRAFCRFLGEGSTIADITSEAIDGYQISRRKRAAATIAKDLTAIRSFCRFLTRPRLRAGHPTLEIAWPEKDEPLPRCLTSDELTRLDKALDLPLPLL